MTKPELKPIRLYHFTAQEHAIADIVLRRLKIARINELNDPFEFVGSDLSDRAWRDTLMGLKDAFSEQFGLICFSRTWRDPVQWSHYADHHRGICLGFDISPAMVVQVNYVRSRSVIPAQYQDISFKPEDPVLTTLIRELMRTKFAHWSYEDEFRLFADLKTPEWSEKAKKNLYFADFDLGLKLREVIVGANCTASPKDIEDAVSGYNDVTVRKARPAFRSFRMVEQKSKYVWEYPPCSNPYSSDEVLVASVLGD